MVPGGPVFGLVPAATYSTQRLRFHKTGIFDRDKKLAEVSDVVQQTPKGDVREVAEAPHSHVGRNIALGVAIAAGLFLVVLLVGHLTDP